MIGDFNAKSCNLSINDTTTPEGAHLESITSLSGMKQFISEPTHNLQQPSSCIDLIVTNPPNIVRNSGVDPFLHSKCHHQIIYSKLSLKMGILLLTSVKLGVNTELRLFKLIAQSETVIDQV